MNTLALGARGFFRQRINEPGSALSICDCLLFRHLKTKVTRHPFDWIINQPSHNHSWARAMKVIVSSFIFAACQLCPAVGDTNIITMSEWSKPISLRNQHLHDIGIRGRLLILQGMEPAYGGPPTTNGAMTFIELQNVYEASGDGIEVYFAVTNLHCELSDANGRVVPKPTGGGGSGRGPFSPCWVNLPYNSTIRLFVNGGTLEPLAVYPSGEPWLHWSILATDTNRYFLTGTLNLSTHPNLSLSPEFREMDYKLNSTATLEFPKVEIRANRRASQQEAK